MRVITLWAGSVSVVGKNERCGQQRQQRRTVHASMICTAAPLDDAPQQRVPFILTLQSP